MITQPNLTQKYRKQAARQSEEVHISFLKAHPQSGFLKTVEVDHFEVNCLSLLFRLLNHSLNKLLVSLVVFGLVPTNLGLHPGAGQPTQIKVDLLGVDSLIELFSSRVDISTFLFLQIQS